MSQEEQELLIPQEKLIQPALLNYLRHELCTPINAIIAYSELLLDEMKSQLDSEVFSDLQKIQNSGVQLLELVKTILDPAHLETSQSSNNLDSFAANIRLEMLTPLSTIMGYCEMLLEGASRQFLPDLEKIYTASKHLLNTVTDIVSIAHEQSQVAHNTAHPIPAQLSNQKTTELVQNANTTILSIQQEILSQEVTQTGKLLLVDHNETNCDLLKRQLEREGYEVVTATNSDEALSELTVKHIDLILLDLIMPGMYGFSFLQLLKNHPVWQNIPVIMISALDQMESIVKCIGLGAEDYLLKPFDLTMLKLRIGVHLEKQRLREKERLYLQQVEQLTTAAAEVETNTFDPQTLTDLAQHDDKLGQLARVFQRMVSEAYLREQCLQKQVQNLQIAIDGAKHKLMVSQIVETDHFQQLQKRAKEAEKLEDREAKQHLSRGGREQEKQPKIISIHSYRGGTGKSNLTSNLATCLASQGLRVGIVDTDIQSPGIHILFELDEEIVNQTLNDFLWGNCAIRDSAYDVSHVLSKQSSGTSSGRIYLIPSSIQPNNITRILREGYNEQMLLNGFQELIRDLQLDYLLVDTHPGINEETLQAITVSHLLIVLLRPDYQDYQGTAVTVELARMLAVTEILLVVNKALPIFNPNAFQQQIEATYNVPLAGILPLSEEMAHLASSGIFGLRYPNHPWSQAIQAIAQQIISYSSKMV
ncbi:response regulator [Scytonema sp. NUACC26]|uniref:response regulator n=1 Tax=Scytonema sp. NUACC26 TaxID=3140176 RepID=UPI0034DBF5F1